MNRVARLLVTVALASGCSATHHGSSQRVQPQQSGTTTPTARVIAADSGFADLPMVRAWLAATIAQNAAKPTEVRAQIVRTTVDAFEAAARSTRSHDETPVYGVQLTGTSFVCPCDTPQKFTGPALRLTWNPDIHYVATLDVGLPIDLTKLGHVFDLEIGHPTQPAPSGPQCEQHHGPPVAITTVARLDHTVPELPEVFTSPGKMTPTATAQEALKAVITLTPYALAAHVKATLAYMTGPPNAILPGSRLVWILSVPSVELTPSLGLPLCGSAAVVIDATTNKNLLEYAGDPNL